MSSAGRIEALQAQLGALGRQFRYRVRRFERGRVTAVGDSVLRVRGLSQAGLGELLHVEGGGSALTLDLQPGDIGAAVLLPGRGIREGDTVEGAGAPVSVPVGDSLLGRIVDPLGRPLDGHAAPTAAARWPVERPAPPVVEREPVSEPLLTGLTVVDALFPIGRGQRQLVIGDRGSGKSTLVTDTVLNQLSHGVRCVYVSIGQKASSVLELQSLLERSGALANTIVVAASPEMPPGMRYLAPYSGCSMAEMFRDRGEDALVVFDDLTAHAIAYRELSLLLRRPPGREAYPGDIFYIHSRLLERATRMVAERGGGSLTALPVAETQAGRIADFIPTNLISITDGQLYLNTTLFARGIKPAVDVGLSVSRVGGKTQRLAMKAVAAELRLDMARFGEMEVFTRFGARIEEETRRRLHRGERARELLRQAPGSPRSLGEQVAALIALQAGWLDDLETDRVRPVTTRLTRVLLETAPQMLRGFAQGRPIEDVDREVIRNALAEALR